MIKHGQSGKKMTPVYRAYLNARQRCRPNHKHYAYYGGRGIKFLFNSFEQWFAELGPRPSPKHQVDRRDNNKSYEPGNVHWVTKFVQMSNRNVLGAWKNGRRWRAQYFPETGKPVHLGYFDTKEEAVAAHRAAKGAACQKQYPRT